jgi:hypothetical protein
LLCNAALDRSPVQSHPAQILSKSFNRARVGTSYYLVISSWRPGRKEENLAVNGPTFRNVYVGERVTVELHPGLFGLSWVGRILPDQESSAVAQ